MEFDRTYIARAGRVWGQNGQIRTPRLNTPNYFSTPKPHQNSPAEFREIRLLTAEAGKV
jgi:hypothetical protein